MKRRLKTKNVFLSLLILTLVGVVCYGVYSYYYSSGSVTHTGTIEVDGFDVEQYNNDGWVFVGGEHYGYNLFCNYFSENTLKCTNTYPFANDGSKDVTVSISNLDATASLANFDEDISIISVSHSWSGNSITISPNNKEYLTITAYVQVLGYTEPSENVIEVTSPVPLGELEVYVTYDITATEVHD